MDKLTSIEMLDHPMSPGARPRHAPFALTTWPACVCCYVFSCVKLAVVNLGFCIVACKMAATDAIDRQSIDWLVDR
ncbi:unnamed protein product [Pieris brassicae]|uniref:Uncharacterized protein n=1 Tax=Pieris brassicae TaxID=7116 RepID=A0A9P0THF1_PIEBR|nr:unnamed protein product [Pieris brassicae]